MHTAVAPLTVTRSAAAVQKKTSDLSTHCVINPFKCQKSMEGKWTPAELQQPYPSLNYVSGLTRTLQLRRYSAWHICHYILPSIVGRKVNRVSISIYLYIYIECNAEQCDTYIPHSPNESTPKYVSAMLRSPKHTEDLSF